MVFVFSTGVTETLAQRIFSCSFFIVLVVVVVVAFPSGRCRGDVRRIAFVVGTLRRLEARVVGFGSSSIVLGAKECVVFGNGDGSESSSVVVVSIVVASVLSSFFVALDVSTCADEDEDESGILVSVFVVRRRLGISSFFLFSVVSFASGFVKQRVVLRGRVRNGGESVR